MLWTTLGINIAGTENVERVVNPPRPAGRPAAAGMYVLASVVGSVTAAAAGFWLGRRLA